ncbi:MAG: efflux RND transporter permease subunit [Pseudomonadota bacterium]
MANSEVKGLFSWFAQNHVAANLLMTLLMVGGLVVALTMPVEIFPEIDPRTITVSVPYPGSTPDEVEEGINRRVEEALAGIDGIQKVRSYATEGVGTIIADLDDGVDDREILDDVKTAVESIEEFPPDDAEDPNITDTAAKRFVITIAIYGDVAERTLRELAYRVRDDLTSFDEITNANVIGVRDYEIGVDVSEATLQKYNLTFNEVAEAVRNFSLNLPGGTIRSDVGEVLLRTDQQAYNQKDFEGIILRSNTNGTVLSLGDVATINDGFENIDRTSIFNGKPAAFVDVVQVGNQKSLDIEEVVKKYVNELSVPTGISITTWSNYADSLRSRIDLLVRNGLMGLVLVFGVLVMFLNLKLAFWTTMGIPISFLGAFILIAAGGGTINMISAFAFIVVLGIVVDDAIIIGESIYAKYEEGLSRTQAALQGLSEVISPVTIGVITTIIAFIPMFFTAGIIGQILKVIPLVVVSVLIMSLIEAFLILPAHLSNIKMHHKQGALPLMQSKLRIGLQNLINKVYVPSLQRVLNMPYVVVAIAISLFMLMFGAINGGQIKTVFFPTIEGDEISARLRMPNGTPASETERAVRHMIAMAYQTQEEFDEKLPPGVDSVYKNLSASVGSTPFSGRGPDGSENSSIGSNYGEVKIELLEGEVRPFSASQIESRWRELVGEIPGAEIYYFSNLFSVGSDVYVELSHDNFETLLITAEKLKQSLTQFDGVSEIEDSFNVGKPELQLALTKEGLAAGLTLNNLARQVRQAFYGEEAQRVQRGRDDIKVLVRYSENERRDLSSIYDMRIRLNDGTEVPLSNVAKINDARGFSVIERSNRRRVVDVTANVIEEEANANEINKNLRENILPRLKSEYPGLAYNFEGAQKERKDSFASLLKALAIAVIGIFALLATQLRSYSQPLIIMSVIPIGFIGAVLGHLILGYEVSFFSFFGIVALSGVVINDSLILMDMINRLRSEGAEVMDAIVTACKKRFRPIMFTTLTTCAGLSPIILEKSLQAQFLIPMAISLAAGVVFATLITLVLVPSLYLIRSNLLERLNRIRMLPSSSTSG